MGIGGLSTLADAEPGQRQVVQFMRAHPAQVGVIQRIARRQGRGQTPKKAASKMAEYLCHELNIDVREPNMD